MKTLSYVQLKEAKEVGQHNGIIFFKFYEFLAKKIFLKFFMTGSLIMFATISNFKKLPFDALYNEYMMKVNDESIMEEMLFLCFYAYFSKYIFHLHACNSVCMQILKLIFGILQLGLVLYQMC